MINPKLLDLIKVYLSQREEILDTDLTFIPKDCYAYNAKLNEFNLVKEFNKKLNEREERLC